MATLLDRLRQDSDYLTDGNVIYPTDLAAYILAWSGGALTTAQFKTAFNMTSVQGTQLDAILATRPAAPLLLLNVPAYVQWVGKLAGLFIMIGAYQPLVDTDAKSKAALGI